MKNGTAGGRYLLVAGGISLVVLLAQGMSPTLAGETKYKYDALGRVIEVFYPDNTKIKYAYDPAGNRTQALTTPNATASTSSSSGANIAPTCTNQSNTVTGIPANVTATFTVSADQFTGLCNDPNGDPLLVTVPTPIPYQFTLAAASTKTINYTVSDGRGGTASGIVTYTRP